jgi:D-alanine--poly(phosphoribitol) ligase subunit 1
MKINKNSTKVIDLFYQSVKQYGKNIGLISSDIQTTYNEINFNSDCYVQSFLTIGIGKGDYVGVFMAKSNELIYTILAILKIGAVYIPITPDYPIERIRYIVNNANIKYIVCDKKRKNIINNINLAIEIIDSENLSCINPKNEKHNILDVSNSDTVYVFYTSGSTGKPKGVMIHQEGFYNRIKWQREYFKMTDKEMCLFKAPIGFDISLWEIFLPLTTGSTLVISKDEGYLDINYLINLIISNDISIIQFVPSLLGLFLDKIKKEKLENKIKLKRVVSSGEELTKNLVKKFYSVLKNAKLYNFYGPTETSICVTANLLTSKNESSYISLGKPIDNTNIYLLDKDMSIIDEDGKTGEIYISGVCVGNGYINLPELNKKVFLKNKFDNYRKIYKTGDEAKYLNGELIFIGRSDRTVKINGNRVDLNEIESVMRNLDYLQIGIVKFVKKKSNSKILVVYYKHNDTSINNKIIEERIKKDLKNFLPTYMIPNLFIYIKNVILNNNGKFDLSGLDIEESNIKIENNEQFGMLKKFIYEMTHQGIGYDEDFLENGGSSIEAILLIEKVNKFYNLSLNYVDFIGKMTINELIKAINNNRNT